MSKKSPAEVIPETANSEVPTTGTGRTPIDPVARAEKILASQAAWRAKNKEKVAGYQAKWRNANADKVKAAHKRYQAKNPDKVKAWHKKSQAKQRELLREAKAILAQRQSQETTATA